MSRPPNKWFGVAINNYPNAPLRGCVADRQTVMKDFGSRFNYVGWDWRSAINATATKQRIIEGLKWLGTGSKDQTRVFTASGHGTPQTKAGKLQTVFCPVNFDWSEENSLFAHEILEIIGNYPSGGRLLIVWDSCYSEWDSDDGMRSINSLVTPRLVTARAYPMADQPDMSELNTQQVVHEDTLAKAIESGAVPCCYLPACLTKGIASPQGETAADVTIGGASFGAHTNKLSKIWNAVPFVTSFQNVADQQRAELAAEQYQQHCYAQGSQKSLTLAEMFGK